MARRTAAQRERELPTLVTPDTLGRAADWAARLGKDPAKLSDWLRRHVSVTYLIDGTRYYRWGDVLEAARERPEVDRALPAGLRYED